jgi:hypothetical protein
VPRRAAQATVPEGFVEHQNELSLVVDGLTSALDDLREIALGIHPAGLSDDGLTPAGMRKRADGRMQVTYNHHPLYMFAKDKAKGQTNGEGVNAFGGTWDVVSPAGSKIVKNSSSGGGGIYGP